MFPASDSLRMKLSSGDLTVTDTHIKAHVRELHNVMYMYCIIL